MSTPIGNFIKFPLVVKIGKEQGGQGMLKNLKSLRQEYGISQQYLADRVFVTQTSINK